MVQKTSRHAPHQELLRSKLADPEFRQREGFPIGADADILRLSSPPFYTCCPNPFLGESLRRAPESPTTARPTEPFAADITEGKAEAFYNLHSYHTKVPYRAIARFLLHYTLPGDIVLDGFAGTGMLGVAAQACADAELVSEMDPHATAGARTAVLVELSPAASHIAANYNAHVDTAAFAAECERILSEFRDELGWMFETVDPESGQRAPVDYYVWSDVFACPSCCHEFEFWSTGVDRETGYKTSSRSVRCPSCDEHYAVKDLIRVESVYDDDLLRRPCKRQSESIVRIAYRHDGERRDKAPDADDLAILARIAARPLEQQVPIVKMQRRDGVWGDMYRSGYHLGVTHLHHFYTRRSLHTVAWLWDRVERSPEPIRPRLRWWLQSVGIGFTRLNRYFASSYSQVNRYLKGFLYIGQVRAEVAPWYALSGKAKRMARNPRGRAPVFVSTGSATALDLPDASVDYVFTDPPFGGNIRYSELNFLWEAWLGAYTDRGPEAIMSPIQAKSLEDYGALIHRAFAEFYRVLKPGRWMTLLFHNSDNAVWQAMQSALQQAGFAVAAVSVFDKKQLTMKQQTAAGAVQKDLIISARRPLPDELRPAPASPVTEEAAWDFVADRLRELPKPATRDGMLVPDDERTSVVLFDRTVAFFLQRGAALPVSAPQFYAGLAERFEERDGMYFC